MGTRRNLRPAKTTRTHTTGRGVTELRTTLQVPAGKFRFAACFGARSQAAMGPVGVRPRCGHRRFGGGRNALYQGTGIAPFGYPNQTSIDRARRYLAGRSGVKSFAVVTSEGRLYGTHVHRRFVSASVVKAMLLVAYLHKLHHEHRALDADSRSLLGPMIHVSDNDAATRVWAIVGDGRLRRLRPAGRDEGLLDPGVLGERDDQRRRPGALLLRDEAAPATRVPPLRGSPAFSHHGSESWGIPAVARRRGWNVFFKGGWRPTSRGQLVHQVARLHRPHMRIAIAVLTDGDPSMGYGINTIEGTTGRLLSRRP